MINRLSKNRYIVVAFIVLIVAALTVSVAMATHITPSSAKAYMVGCSVHWQLKMDPATSWNITVYDLKSDGSLGSVLGTDNGDSGDKVASGRVWVGYSDRVAVHHHDGQFATLDVKPCNTDEPQYWWFSVMGLPGGSVEATQPAADGSLACGLFDVQGWGMKTVDLANYPDCSGNVSVMCLDGDGAWTDGNISGLSQEGTVVSFTSGQHGTCGFFE